MTNKLALDYEPRSAFVPFHQRNTRWAAMCCHRRAGKTVACIHDLVLRALYTKKTRAKFAYIGPFRQQAKEIAWEYLKAATEQLRNGQPRESDLKVTLHNGASIQIYGADNAEALRGLYFDGVIIDEYGDCRPSVWGEIVLPTLMDRNGWAVFIGTIKGKNHFYKTLERAKAEDGWFHMELKGSESGILKEADLMELKAQLTDAQYQQEIECNPNAAVMGTYYSDIINKLEANGTIHDYDYDPVEQVYVASDLGYSDSTAMWFWQLTPQGPMMIDYEEHDGQALEFYFKLLKDKPYTYADIWLPHDAQAKTLQTGRSTIEQFLEQGFPCKLVPRLAVQHGIDAVRKMLPITRIDRRKCYQGVEALRAYRRKYNEKTQAYSEAPLHDWSSNGADAYRMFALVTETEAAEIEEKQEVPLFNTPEYTLDEMWAQHEKENSWRDQILRI